jgi:hypothetical protein
MRFMSSQHSTEPTATLFTARSNFVPATYAGFLSGAHSFRESGKVNNTPTMNRRKFAAESEEITMSMQDTDDRNLAEDNSQNGAGSSGHKARIHAAAQRNVCNNRLTSLFDQSSQKLA